MMCELEQNPALVSDEFIKDGLKMDSVSADYGCKHYKRRCKIRAPCCDQIFDCRHCHNEAKNAMEIDPINRHDIPRHQVKRVLCSLCDTEQDVQQNCISCGVCMGNYFCNKCKFFDNDISKKQYHCDECGICRLPRLPCQMCTKTKWSGYYAMIVKECLKYDSTLSRTNARTNAN